MSQGIVYLVGAGPGDPGLITRRGESIIRRAEVLVYDHLVSQDLIRLAPTSAKRIYVGKRRGHHEMSQLEINQVLCQEALAGHLVVRLKGGDPYVFGRGAEEAETLFHAGIPFRVVPGVTAGIGALTYAGLPVTHRDYASSVAFVTGHDDPDSPECRADWPLLAQFQGTIVVYMGVTRLPRIAQVLIQHGKKANTPVAMVERGSWPSQRVVVSSLKEISESCHPLPVKPPALVMIGEVVRARPSLDWWSKLPLHGQTVLVTRPETDSRESVELLEELGAEVLLAPTISVRPAEDPAGLDQALAAMDSYDWLVFTSANGVRFFIERIFQTGRDLRILGHIRLAVIGPATAFALNQFGLNADVVPANYQSEDLASALAGHVQGKSILLARADRGRSILKDELIKTAHKVEQVTVYHNSDVKEFHEDILAYLTAGKVDWVTLTSSANVRRFMSMLPGNFPADVFQELKFASLSPITTQAAREVGIEPTVEAQNYHFAGLIQAILQHSLNEKD
ncbi:MAG: uroporphyrinogen-III C-methyltransferase [Planctomycetota bacterium]